MTPIDLNADLGEGFGPWRLGDDAAMLDIVSTANLACGFHAGDPEIMRATVRAAKARGVAVGAHPGFADRAGFGRRRLPVGAAEMENMVAYQIGALSAIGAVEGYPVTHVKTHGALGNMCAEDLELALAVARAIRAVDATLTFIVMPGQATERAAERLGLRAVREIYADRTYQDDFNLTSRSEPGAVLHDADAAIRHVTRMLDEGALISTSGKRLRARIDSVCIHGDAPEAVSMARAVRQRLEAMGHTISPFAAGSVSR
jgi:UPF0271 protein